MRKLILIFLFISSIAIAQQRKVLFLDITDTTHNNNVYNSFVTAYNLYNSDWTDELAIHKIAVPSQEMFDTAIANNCAIIVCSTSGATSYINLAKSNWTNGVMLVMPTGSNSHIKLYNDTLSELVMTGADFGHINATAYNVEYLAIDNYGGGSASSYSNGAVAGTLLSIINHVPDCTNWEARYRLRYYSYAGINGWTAENGFGGFSYTTDVIDSKIDELPGCPYPLPLKNLGEIPNPVTVEKKLDNSLFTVNFSSVPNAIEYYIYKNSVLYDSSAMNNFSIILEYKFKSDITNNSYDIRAVGNDTTKVLTSFSQKDLPKYINILIR